MVADLSYISTSFADVCGRTWTVVFDPALLPRVSQETGVDLTSDGAYTKIFYDVARDPVLLAAALWVFLAEQAAQRGTGREDFESSLNGDVLDAGELALWAAYIDAVLPRHKRAALRRDLRQLRERLRLRYANRERNGEA